MGWLLLDVWSVHKLDVWDSWPVLMFQLDLSLLHHFFNIWRTLSARLFAQVWPCVIRHWQLECYLFQEYKLFSCIHGLLWNCLWLTNYFYRSRLMACMYSLFSFMPNGYVLGGFVLKYINGIGMLITASTKKHSNEHICASYALRIVPLN